MVYDPALGRYKEWMESTKRWRWADNKRFCDTPGSLVRTTSAPPGGNIIPDNLVVATSRPQECTEVPEINLDEEERRSKMAKKILDTPTLDPETSVSISIRQISEVADMIDAELKRMED